jgi:hypothetical protein
LLSGLPITRTLICPSLAASTLYLALGSKDWSWAAAIFPDWKPHPNTLRNWVHNGKIRPAPKKIGNKYFCDPKAEYVDPIADKIERMTRGS